MLTTDFEGSLATPEMIELCRYLYANIPITKSPTIKLTGEDSLVDSFISYASTKHDYFADIGIEMPKFIRVDFGDPEAVPVIEKDKDEMLDDIMIRYI